MKPVGFKTTFWLISKSHLMEGKEIILDYYVRVDLLQKYTPLKYITRVIQVVTLDKMFAMPLAGFVPCTS